MAVHALVVGSLVMDLAFRVAHRPEAGDLVVADEFGAFRGGRGYNQAVALARLGAEVTMIGAVGSDGYGDGFLQALEREGIDAGRVVQMRGTSTGVAVPLITPDGRAGFVQYPGANRYLAPAHCAELPDCDVLLLQGEVSAATSLYAARVIHGRGGTVLLRPTPVDGIDHDLVSNATIVAPNQPEAITLLERLGADGGLPALQDPTSASPEELARALATPERGAVVTVGAYDAAWAAPTDGEETAGFVHGPDVATVDTTAATASFNAALAIALAEGAGYEEAAHLACGAGAYAATVRGAEPSLPGRAAVDSLLTEHGRAGFPPPSR
ncbi:PfkB family carbohydrate kinase [Egibacter rhizosphaerae]|nr:PfkB family carbohydrate kinase [Egibacter rhizosphaerae]